MTSHGDKSQPAHGGRAVDQINHVRDVGQSVRRLLLEQDQGLGNVELRAEYPCDERGLRRPIMSSSSAAGRDEQVSLMAVEEPLY